MSWVFVDLSTGTEHITDFNARRNMPVQDGYERDQTAMGEGTEMTWRIFKYDVPVAGGEVYEIPVGYQVLSCINQNDHIVVYVKVDDGINRKANVEFTSVGTGWYLSTDEINFIGTVAIADGSLVFHVFYREVER